MTWLGHASALIELDGARLMTDPILGKRIGPLIRIAPPVPAGALRDIDAALISHLHADHADPRSLRKLGARVIAPRGSARWFARNGLQVEELGPGEETQVGAVRISATQAMHSGRRWRFGADADAIGFVTTGSQACYFAGDTDLYPGMSELAGSIDIALLPVSGWGSRLGPGHLDPARAAAAVSVIVPRVAVPIHWGTFVLGWPARRPRRPGSAGAPLQRTRLWTGAGRRGALAHAGRADGVGAGAAHSAECLPGARVSARDRSQADARAHPRRPIARILTVWLSSTATLVLLSALLSGIEVDSFGAALGAAALIGMLNALLWPLILRFALPLTVLTLGLGAVILNGAIVLLASAVDVGLKVSSLSAAIATTVAITIVSTAISSALAIDDDGFWYRHVLGRYGKRRAPPQELESPGLLFLEIDGLAHDVLLRAIRDGNAPTMARWVQTGSHRLARWETDWSSQTGACQAGLLHGNNYDMPAFRWWEKDRGRAIVTNHPRDAAELERRHSDGRGLLFSDGSSRANIVSGDAPHSLLTMSTVLRRDRTGRIGQDYFAYFADPYNVTRTFILAVREVASELWSASRQRRLDVRPRVHRSLGYSLVRAWATVIQRDLQVNSIIADIYAGRPVVYSTFLAYDEVAHHSGIERPETLATLRQVDRQIGRIAAAIRSAPRPYRLVVLSDHGQSQGATFLDRYGATLEDLVRGAVAAGAVSMDGHPSEALAFLGASVTELSAGVSRRARTVRRLSRSHAEDGEVRLGEGTPAAAESAQPPEVVVMASGCLGLVSFPREPGRVTLELIERRYPTLIASLRQHPGIGFLLVRSEQHGAIVIGPSGINYLDEDRVDGEDPLSSFGPNAAMHVRRTDGFPHCPDIVINSTYWRDSDEVAAFEELVGSHGGLGGTQSYPFLLHPAELELPGEEMVGAEAVHRQLRTWLVELGHDEYQPAASRVPHPPAARLGLAAASGAQADNCADIDA